MIHLCESNGGRRQCVTALPFPSCRRSAQRRGTPGHAPAAGRGRRGVHPFLHPFAAASTPRTAVGSGWKIQHTLAGRVFRCGADAEDKIHERFLKMESGGWHLHTVTRETLNHAGSASPRPHPRPAAGPGGRSGAGWGARRCGAAAAGGSTELRVAPRPPPSGALPPAGARRARPGGCCCRR